MYIKTVAMFLFYLVPLAVVFFSGSSSLPLLFLCYGVSAVGVLGIGMGVMHDANHGTYSVNPKINQLVGYALNLIGANSDVWKMQHNVLHHTFTNVSELDDDLNPPKRLLRFSPNAPRYKIHKFQHI
jgi:linoleoyl-CoA desaturase